MVGPDTLVALVQGDGLLLLFPLALVEGPIVTVIAAWLARADPLLLTEVYAVCVAADLLGDLGLYALGRRAPALPPRWRRRLGLGGDRLARLAAHFETRGARTLLLGKLTHSGGFAVLLAAGASHMRLAPFLLFNLLGTLPKTAALMALGYAFGAAYGAIDAWLFRVSALMFLMLAGAALLWLRARRRAR